MLVYFTDKSGTILWLSDVHPDHRQSGICPEDFVGANLFDDTHMVITGGKDQLRYVFESCAQSSETLQCEICVEVAGTVGRWLLKLDRIEENRIAIRSCSLPYALHDLSRRANQVVELISDGLNSVQIARRLGITLSAVEKHRSKIKKVLRLGDEQQLPVVARHLIDQGGYFFDTVNPEEAGFCCGSCMNEAHQ
mgnify:FL=1